MNLVIVTGYSGSGKSVALNVLEDLDYYCIDNLPVAMMTAFTEQVMAEWGKEQKKIAVGIDARSGKSGLDALPESLERLREKGIDHSIFFLHSDEDTLVQRFHLTRRKHPLSKKSTSLLEALKLEKEMLKPVMKLADHLIDTSRTNIYQLRDLIKQHVDPEDSGQMVTQLQSFGFKYGVPSDADLVFDARCLPNPYWDSALRNLTGFDDKVIEFLEQYDEVKKLLSDLTQFITDWIPHYEKTSRKYFNIAIGCTGGQHRSVYIVNKIQQQLEKVCKDIIVRHRELT